MIRDQLSNLLAREPFEPFQIKLVNRDGHNVFHRNGVLIEMTTVTIRWPYRRWVVFPIDKIVSLESLIANYPDEVANSRS